MLLKTRLVAKRAVPFSSILIHNGGGTVGHSHVRVDAVVEAEPLSKEVSAEKDRSSDEKTDR